MAIRFPGEQFAPSKPNLERNISFSTASIGGVEKFGAVTVDVDIDGVVNDSGDTMSGKLAVVVSTASEQAIVVRSNDNDTTKNTFEVQDSTQVALASINPLGTLQIKVYNQSAEPTTSELPAGYACFWTDTDDSKCYLCYNHGGTVKTVELT